MKNEAKHTARSSYRCQCRIVFAPNCRRKVIIKQIRKAHLPRTIRSSMQRRMTFSVTLAIKHKFIGKPLKILIFHAKNTPDHWGENYPIKQEYSLSPSPPVLTQGILSPTTLGIPGWAVGVLVKSGEFQTDDIPCFFHL